MLITYRIFIIHPLLSGENPLCATKKEQPPPPVCEKLNLHIHVPVEVSTPTPPTLFSGGIKWKKNDITERSVRGNRGQISIRDFFLHGICDFQIPLLS